jgi:hypothetical protein
VLDFKATASSEEDMSLVNFPSPWDASTRITFFQLHLSYSPTRNLKVVIAVPGHSVSVRSSHAFLDPS